MAKILLVIGLAIGIILAIYLIGAVISFIDQWRSIGGAPGHGGFSSYTQDTTYMIGFALSWPLTMSYVIDGFLFRKKKKNQQSNL